ncbi:MAG: hypothetical protein EXS39_07440 [Opitutaceae bacterium]|nr:hypothetical protein [Opitutaceae bacterium]
MASLTSNAGGPPAVPAPGRRATDWGTLAHWLPLLAVFAVEFLLFDQVGAKRHTWIYPRWNDQIQYLTECYTGYEYLRAHGFWPGLWQTLVNPSAQGTLHDFFALLVFSVVGPSRSAALSLNLFALIAWQAMLYLAIWRTTGARALAWAVALLPIALRWPWNNWAGSMVDFRLDHLGMCALGLTLAAALLTDGFRVTRWSALFGFSVGLTLLARFITGPYFVLIFASLLVWCLCRPDGGRCTGNLLLAALVAALLAGPIFWLNREWVWNYYWIGHFTGPESAIRNPHMGLGAALAFVWRHLAESHLGDFFWWLSGAGAAVLALGTWLGRRAEARPLAVVTWWVPGTIFLLAPAAVLTLHQQKSEIVVGALVPGAVALVAAAWVELHRRCTAVWPTRALATVMVVAAGWFFSVRQLAPAYNAAFAADARKVNLLADYLFATARAAGLANPRIGVDQVTDCLDGQIMRVICYERKKTWMPFIMTLPTGIWKEKEPLLFERLAQSDFVFLTEDGPEGVWPYDAQMHALLPLTSAWCESHLRRVERFTIFGKHMALYQRREIPFP